MCKAGDLWITLGPLEPAPYFQTPSLILIQRIDKGRRWKGRLLPESLISLVRGQGGQIEPSSIAPQPPGSTGLLQRDGRGSRQCKDSQNVSITLTTCRQSLCRFTHSCLRTYSSLCLEHIKPHLPGELLLGILRFSSSTTYLDPLSAITYFAYISTQHLSTYCTCRFLKHVFFPSLRAHCGQRLCLIYLGV